MRFSQYNFTEEIKKNLENLGYRKPTDIQYKAIPPILKGEDVLAIAQTGTGKTAAYAIPVLQLLSQRKARNAEKQIRCIVMVPTHELAIQVTEVFDAIGKGTSIKALGLFGGVKQDLQIETLKHGVDILVATPGRLFDLKSQGYLSLSSVEILVLDEADHMLELGFYHDMVQLIRNIPKKRQTLFFSATINEHIKDLAYDLVQRAVRIHISPKDPVSKNIDHSVAFIEMDDKRFFLERIIKENPGKKILVFVRTKVRAERVSKALERVNIPSQTIHGNKDQNERTDAMTQFKEGKNMILIATDVSARGIDIPNVEIVVNYDLPDEAENYVHRVGRTGRGTQRGIAISFCSAEEKETLDIIEGFLNKEIKVLDIRKDEYEEILDASEAANHDWRSLIAEAEEAKKKRKKKKK
ncbi:MAG TPA: DEAD/DEAH box helicase [Bacteroidales bacterium]|nr:DEAD/DEAH box helicase [Bacteroidales bacterium]